MTTEKRTLEGTKANEFCLPDSTGQIHCLSEFKGKWVILYFYPKDNTSGCTREALDFTQNKTDFAALDAVIIGVSKDNPASHAKFISKHNLDILLLSNESREVIEKYGAWGEKKLYGKTYFGTVRSTFLINPQQIIVKQWSKVKVNGHADEVIKFLNGVK